MLQRKVSFLVLLWTVNFRTPFTIDLSTMAHMSRLSNTSAIYHRFTRQYFKHEKTFFIRNTNLVWWIAFVLIAYWLQNEFLHFPSDLRNTIFLDFMWIIFSYFKMDIFIFLMKKIYLQNGCNVIHLLFMQNYNFYKKKLQLKNKKLI